MPVVAKPLPTTEQLDAFLHSLRRVAFMVGPDELAGAQKILLLAHAEADGGLAARRLKTMLAPIVVRNPTQQADFYRRFDALMIEIAPAPAAVLVPQAGTRSASGATTGSGSTNRRRRVAVLAAAGSALLAIACGLWLWWPSTPVPAPIEPIPTAAAPPATVAVLVKQVSFVTATLYRRPGYQWAQAGLMVLPLLLFAGWMVWRWRRRVLWLERHPGIRQADPAIVRLPEQHQPLFPAAELTAITPDLRRHLRVPSRDLDIDRTIPETMEGGGSFTPVWQTVPRSPSYLFLVEKESAHDHVAGILDRAVERLVNERVAVERYYFRDDPRWLIGEGRGRIEPIADVAARYGDHRLVVLGGGDGFFEPLSNRLETGVEQALSHWTPRAVLSTKPIQTWSWHELALVDQGGFDLATASHSGLRALADRAGAETDRAAEMLEGVVVSMPARPSLNLREPPQPTPLHAPRGSRRSALLICVGRDGEREAEALRFARLLERQFLGFEVRVLLDPDQRTATDALDSLVEKNSGTDDTILVHFYGSVGQREYSYGPAHFSLPGGVKPLLLLGSSTSIEISEFARQLHQPGGGRQVVILDGLSERDPIAVEQIGTDRCEVIWAFATAPNRGLTRLLADAIEQDLAHAEPAEITLRMLFDFTRERASRRGILDDLNLNYFATMTSSVVITVAPLRAANAVKPPSVIFISYARENDAAAGRVCDFLEKEVGANVWAWLDSRRLSGGEDWYEESRRQIDNCSYFIPVISAEALRRQEGLFRREWAQAAERARGLAPSTPFIVPVVIDDTSADADGTPDEFRGIHWTRLPNGAGDEAFRRRMTSLIQEHRRREGRLKFSPTEKRSWTS